MNISYSIKHYSAYIKNSAWMLLENLLRVFSTVVVSIYVARYLGPIDFGILSFTLAVVAILMAFSRLGFESTLVKDLSKHPAIAEQLLGTALTMVFVVGLMVYILLITLSPFLGGDDKTNTYLFIIALGLLFQPVFVFDYFFQSKVLARISTYAKVCALIVSSLVKIFLVVNSFEMVWIVLAYAMDYFLLSLFLVMFYIKNWYSFEYMKFSFRLAKPLIKKAIPMALSIVAAIAYLKTDLVMIYYLLDDYSVGIYAASARIFDGLVMLPVVVSISLLPLLTKKYDSSRKEYEAFVGFVLGAFVWLGIVVGLVFSINSSWIISMVFGHAYTSADEVLAIISWAFLLTAVGSILSRHFVVIANEYELLKRTVVGLFLNVVLNYFFILEFGLVGAAYGTIVTLLVVNILMNFLTKESFWLNKKLIMALMLPAVLLTRKRYGKNH